LTSLNRAQVFNTAARREDIILKRWNIPPAPAARTPQSGSTNRRAQWWTPVQPQGGV